MKLFKFSFLNDHTHTFAISLMYLSASLVFLGSDYKPLPFFILILRYSVIFLILIYFSIVGIIRVSFKRRITLHPISWLLLFTWFLFSFTVFISEIVHEGFVTESVFYLFIVPLVYFYFVPMVIKDFNKVLLWGLFWSSFPLIIISLISSPPNTNFSYIGIFANANGLGIICAQAYMASWLLFLYGKKEGRRFIHTVFYLIVICFSVYGIMISTNRTALVVISYISLFTSLHSFFFYRIKRGLLIIGVIPFILFLRPVQNLLNGVIYEFQYLSLNNDLSNGRLDKWLKVINDVEVMGHGTNYWPSLVAHNSFIYVLGVFGVIAFILLLVFIAFSFIKSILYFNSNRNISFSVVPFVLISSFILFSITEIMFGTIGSSLTLAFFHSVGLIIFSNTGMRKREIQARTSL